MSSAAAVVSEIGIVVSAGGASSARTGPAAATPNSNAAMSALTPSPHPPHETANIHPARTVSALASNVGINLFPPLKVWMRQSCRTSSKT
jgi:hypothetical protein